MVTPNIESEVATLLGTTSRDTGVDSQNDEAAIGVEPREAA